MILIDTDVMVDILREYPHAVKWLRSIRDEEILLPGFVVMELIQGCKNKTEQRKIIKTLSFYRIEWPSSETCNNAMKVFADFHLQYNIGIIDVLIGQMAVELNLPLCTFNQKHYSCIPNISLSKPYKR
ncbi:MAG: type II toxin-antitoxin system VapC family toxin [Ignavibacteria bacterium]|nr:type II toxin-antitoxin system VapC family toxin [Ignavibacteria bacterium]